MQLGGVAALRRRAARRQCTSRAVRYTRTVRWQCELAVRGGRVVPAARLTDRFVAPLLESACRTAAVRHRIHRDRGSPNDVMACQAPSSAAKHRRGPFGNNARSQRTRRALTGVPSASCAAPASLSNRCCPQSLWLPRPRRFLPATCPPPRRIACRASCEEEFSARQCPKCSRQ